MKQHLTLELIRDLCEELETERINYCHWKSNAMLDRSASGENDLDLLVGRADAQHFTRILYQLGFKEAQPASQWRYPGILHFYNYDAKLDKLVHIHAHYQLILGHNLLKDYRLPVEAPFLEFTLQNGPFKVPVPELEFIVFVLRMVLKRPLFDLRMHRSLSTFADQELQYLKAQTSQEQMHTMLASYFLYLNSQLFSDCVHSLQSSCSPWKRMKTGWRLHHALRANCRHAWFKSVALKAWRRLAGAFRVRFLKFSTRKRLTHGGVLVAIVGGDGAGKSTAVQAISRWMAKNFDTMPVHMGKPPRSWLTFIVDGVIRLGRFRNKLFGRKRNLQHSAYHGLRPRIGLFQSLRCVCTARDRYRAYVKMRRFTSNGGIAICDRYPLPQVKLMDGPRLGYCEEKTQFFIRFLAQVEKSYYHQISDPDFLLVLRVHPDIAVQRKVEEDAESVRARSQEIWDLDWPQANTHVVDASRLQARVLSELKSLIWSKL